jgi:hypothetical protein
MNVLNQYLQITCLGNGNVGFLMNGPRLVAVSDQCIKARFETTGIPDRSGIVNADTIKELSKSYDAITECCIFITITEARKLGLISKDDQIIFNEPARLN